MTPEQAEALFSVAYDGALEASEQRAFDAALASDAALAEKYAAFRRTLEALAALESTRASELDQLPTPDLLAGVQRRLRNRSGGRYYADRFSERSGWASYRLFGALLLAALLLGLVWLAFGALHAIELSAP